MTRGTELSQTTRNWMQTEYSTSDRAYRRAATRLYGFIMHQSCLPMTRKPRASASGLRVIGKQRGCIIIRVSHECPFDNLFIHRSLHNLKKTGGLFCPGHSYDVETGFLECGEEILWAKKQNKRVPDCCCIFLPWINILQTQIHCWKHRAIFFFFLTKEIQQEARDVDAVFWENDVIVRIGS